LEIKKQEIKLFDFGYHSVGKTSEKVAGGLSQNLGKRFSLVSETVDYIL